MSAKGKTWKNHKYISKVNGRYVYPPNMPNEEDVEPKDTAQKSLIELMEESKERNDKIDAQMKEDVNDIIKRIDDWLSGTTFGKIRDMKIKDLIEMLKHDGFDDDAITDFVMMYDEDYLSHHGIEGQKWGKQNGPPYPLSRGQLSSAEEKKGGVSKSAKEKYGDSHNKKKAKDKVAKAKKAEAEPKEPPKATITKSEAAQHPTRLASAQDVYANRAMYTNQELQAYINRVQLENNIANLARQEYESNHPVKTYIKKKANQTLDNVINNATNAGMNYVKNAFNEAMNGNKSFDGPSLEDIYRNPGKYSTKDMQDALNRQNNLDRISKKVNDSSNKSESSRNVTRPESKLKYYYKR